MHGQQEHTCSKERSWAQQGYGLQKGAGASPVLVLTWAGPRQLVTISGLQDATGDALGDDLDRSAHICQPVDWNDTWPSAALNLTRGQGLHNMDGA